MSEPSTEPATVFWDADALFRLVTTRLPPSESAPLAIWYLTVARIVSSRTTQSVFDCVRGRVKEVYPERSKDLEQRLSEVFRHFEIADEPTQEQVEAVLSEVSDLGDAPILAAAKSSGCFVLLTYNTKHFEGARNIFVVTPPDLVEAIRSAVRNHFEKAL